MDRDGRNDREYREPVAALARITLLEKIGQRGHLRADVERGEEQAQEHEREGGHPLKISVQQPRVVARLGQADQMHAGDIRGKQGQANHGPAQCPASEKILLCLPASAPAQSGPAAEDHNAHRVNDNHRDIEPSERRGGRTGLGEEREGYRHVRPLG